MDLETVAINSPGDMGMGIGGVLLANGLRVVVALDERSARTRELSLQAGLEDVGSVEAMVQEADLLLSVLVPSAALTAAERVAAALRETGAKLLYADCNAVSLAATRKMGEIIASAGSGYMDASIIGPPPRKPGVTRIYASGPEVAAFARLAQHGLDIRALGQEIGAASGIKTCYASMTKGFQALATEMLVTARKLGLEAELRRELETSQPQLLGWLERSMPGMPPKAHRWVGEMEEHGHTYGEMGLTPKLMEGAADMYRYIADTKAGKVAPEAQSASRSLADVVADLT